jgi:hypothetical protein
MEVKSPVSEKKVPAEQEVESPSDEEKVPLEEKGQLTEKNEHRTSNVQHRTLNGKR